MLPLRHAHLVVLCLATQGIAWLAGANLTVVCEYPMRVTHRFFGMEVNRPAYFVLMGMVVLAWVVSLLVLLGCAASNWFSLWRITERERVALCPTCGYDLRATQDRCPECGETIVERSGRHIYRTHRTMRHYQRSSC